jgi:hypothetical protein
MIGTRGGWMNSTGRATNEMMNKKEMEGIMDLGWIGLIRKANWTGFRRQTQGRISGEIKNGKIKK